MKIPESGAPSINSKQKNITTHVIARVRRLPIHSPTTRRRQRKRTFHRRRYSDIAEEIPRDAVMGDRKRCTVTRPENSARRWQRPSERSQRQAAASVKLRRLRAIEKQSMEEKSIK